MKRQFEVVVTTWVQMYARVRVSVAEDEQPTKLALDKAKAGSKGVEWSATPIDPAKITVAAIREVDKDE